MILGVRPAATAVLAAAALALGGCDGDHSRLTSVGELVTRPLASGNVPVTFSLLDPTSAPAAVALLYSLDQGATWNEATTTDGAASYETSPAGTAHTVTWDSMADVGFHTTRPVKLKVQPAGAGATQPAAFVELRNLAVAADRVGPHLFYLGSWDAARVAVAETHDLVVLAPEDPTVTRALVAEIQNGVDPADPADDVIVLGYLNIGQDRRTVGMTDDDMLLDPRFVGDASGPRIDPRGLGATGWPLLGIDPLGLPSITTGFASWYLDDVSVAFNGVGDGHPDRDYYTGACFVNAGDPAWYATVQSMQIDGSDGIAGTREILSKDFGRGFGCDGLFVAGIDTCAPNWFTSYGQPNQAEFEWTAPGFSSFVKRLRIDYPNSVLMQDRGLFFFNPARPHYRFSTRPDIDFVLFTSYRLDADSSQDFNPHYFTDNKYNVAPRLQVEANRPDGFQVLSLGPAAGPGIDPATLLGASTFGLVQFEQDVAEAHAVGFRHYLTDAPATLVNEFVRSVADFADTDPPVWTSTFHDRPPVWPATWGPPTPRIGVQELRPGTQSMTLRWDVALDLHPVRYVAYFDVRPLRFDASGQPSGTRVELEPSIGSGYEFGPGLGTYPYEATIDGLAASRWYYFCVRAVDAVGNEDRNRVVLSAKTIHDLVEITIDGKFDDWQEVAPRLVDPDDVPASAGPNWRDVKVHNDGVNLYVYYRSQNTFNVDGSPTSWYSRTLICIDADNNPLTGFATQGIGSDLVVAGEGLYRQANGIFAEELLQWLPMNPTTQVKECELAIPLARLDAAAGERTARVQVVLINDDVWDVAPDAGSLDVNLVR